MQIAPRIPPRLLDEVERLARRSLPIAEINRLVGASARRLDLPKPSYEQVRALVHEARALRRSPSTASLAASALLQYPRADRYDRLVDRLLVEPPAGRLRDRATPLPRNRLSPAEQRDLSDTA